MQALLTPWLAAADRLAPRWRRCVSGPQPCAIQLLGSPLEDERGETVAPLSSRADQVLLREALDLFALAVRVDAGAFIAVAAPYSTDSSSSSMFYEDGQRLVIQLVLDSRTPRDHMDRDTFGYKALFGPTDSSHDPSAFLSARSALLANAGFYLGRHVGPRFDLEIQVRLCDGVGDLQTDLQAVVDVITAIDRGAFCITRVDVKVESPAFGASALDQFFTQLYRLETEAVVDVSLQLPSFDEDTHTLDEWRTLLEYATLQSETLITDQSERDTLTYSMSVFFGETAEWLAIAALSALSRATRLSSLRLENAAEGHARTQWLGHVLRCANVPSLTVHERLLLLGQLSVMQEPLSSAEGYEGARQSRESSIKDLSVSVKVPTRAPVCVHRLPLLLSAQLERISLEGCAMGIPWSCLTETLKICPRLEALTIRTLHLTPHDPMAVYDGVSHHSKLTSLVLDTRVSSVRFVQAIRPTLQGYGRLLSELRLRCTWFGTPVVDEEPLGGILQACCPTLETLEVRGLQASTIYDHLVSQTPSLARLERLIVESVGSASHILLTTLADQRHPLTRSLRTLHINDDGAVNVDIVRSLLDMLQSNHHLQNVRLVVPRLVSESVQIQELMIAHKAASKNRRRLGLSNKLALIDSLNRVGLRCDPELLAQVFAFAAPSKRRRVLVAFRQGD